MISKIVGELSPKDYGPDSFESKPFPIPYFDNRELKVGFVEAKHQPYLDSADKVLENFIGLSLIDRTENSDMVYHYYSETLKLGYTTPLDIKTTKNIWNFVTPTEIIIHWDEDGDFYFFQKITVGSGAARYSLLGLESNSNLDLNIFTDSLETKNYHYDSLDVHDSPEYVITLRVTYNGQTSVIHFKDDFADINISSYKNSRISGTFTGKLTPETLPLGFGQPGSINITEGKINEVKVIY